MNENELCIYRPSHEKLSLPLMFCYVEWCLPGNRFVPSMNRTHLRMNESWTMRYFTNLNASSRQHLDPWISENYQILHARNPESQSMTSFRLRNSHLKLNRTRTLNWKLNSGNKIEPLSNCLLYWGQMCKKQKTKANIKKVATYKGKIFMFCCLLFAFFAFFICVWNRWA